MRTNGRIHEIEALLRANGWILARTGVHDKWVRGSQTYMVAHHGKRSRLHLGQLRQQLRRLDAERDATAHEG